MSLDRAILFRLATSTRFERAVRAAPGGEARAWRAASRYVAGTDLASARRTAIELDAQGVACSIDQFGEQVTDPEEAAQVAADYLEAAESLTSFPASTWLSVDLSHLGLDVSTTTCAEHLAAAVSALPEGRRLQVGAEDHSRADRVLACVLDVAGRGLAGRLGATVQANLRRSPSDVERLVDAGVHVRLVKGAYVEPAAIALRYGEPTDHAFLGLARRLDASGAEFALATHDHVLRNQLIAELGSAPSVEQLLGVRPDELEGLTARGVPTRVYVPFGDQWFRYWMRRVAESRGA